MTWMDGNGPEADIVISSRVRLARNIKTFAFPVMLNPDQANKALDAVKTAVSEKNAGKGLGKLEFYPLNELSPLDRQVLVEKHLVSPQFVMQPDYKAVILRQDEAVSIMVNEEDHLRMQCLFPGLQLKEAWNLANRVDDLLEETLDFAFCETRGYLTACPTNVGTGLRASVMVHLPALVMTNQIARILEAVGKLGLVVRGFYGEGTHAVGNLFQISNQVSLGQSESDIIENLIGITNQIVEQELAAREALQKAKKDVLEDRICRAFGVLKYGRVISSEEALKLLSDLRLGVDLNIILGLNRAILNQLIVLIQPANLQKTAQKEMTPEERDIIRARVIREKLAAAESKS